MFARVDTNRDGYITQQERQAMRGQMRATMGDAGRGACGRPRCRPGGDVRPVRSNRDNMISRDEWARAEALRGEGRAEGRRGGMGGERMAMRGRMGGAMLRMADTNRDQRISLAEAETAALQRFDRVDLYLRDGRITREERQQARQQRQAQRPAVAPVR